MEDFAISVQGLSKRYSLGRQKAQVGVRGMLHGMRQLFGRQIQEDHSTIWALKDVSFDVRKGERLGFVGKNGAGKSTLLKILSRVAYPTTGEARIRGRVTSLLEVGTGFLGHLTGRENIYLNASFHGLSKKEIDERLADIVEFSELERFIDTPIKFYSSGMRSRLAFSVAAHLDPDILLLDEVLSVGDMAFAQKCLQRVEELTRGERTILFVSHSMDAVRRFCTRCIWLDCGHVVMDGTSEEVTNAFTSDSMSLQAHKIWEPPTLEQQVSAPEMVATQPSPQPPYARFVSASLITQDGRRTATASVVEDICFELIYEIESDDVYVLPDFKIFTHDNILAFNLVHSGALQNPELEKRKAGRYRSIAVLPSHLLNVGQYKVSVSLTTPTSGKLISHATADNVLSFYVHEAPVGTVSALGPYRKVKGVVRPLVEWTDEVVID